ncbi:MAG: sugar ABC transporter permease [Chloroflexi bacterium]|nr:sugar ABC transporter permease [Chloroflexota bacterium]
MILAAVLLFQGLAGAVGGDPNALPSAVIWLVAGVVFAVAFWWLNQNFELYNVGKETLTQASARVAWNLLVPTLIVLVVVALRPLEATFVASLTDERFAAGGESEVNFVGLENYARLISVRFDVVECTRTDGGACEVDDDGELVFPRVRDAVTDEAYRELRFRDVSAITLGESQLVLSARDDDFIDAIGNTLTFTFFSVLIELILGLFIAMVINSNFTGRGIMRAAMLVPWAIPTVVSARLWEIMLRDNQSGVINHFFVNIGLLAESQAWLASPALQIPSLVAIDVWKTTPFMALLLLAGLQTIPSDIYEAADVDGASKVRQFFSMTLPLLRPTIAVALVFRTLDAVRVFDVFQVLLGRQRLSMATYNYETLVQSQQLGYASAIGVVIFVIILLFTLAYVRILGVNTD